MGIEANHCQNSLVQDKMMMTSANVNKAEYGINVGDRTQRLQQWPLLVESKIARCYA